MNKVLCKVVININSDNDIKTLKRLIKKYNIRYIQFYYQFRKESNKTIYKFILTANDDTIQLIKKFNIKSVQFYCLLNVQQVRGLLKNKNVHIVYGDILKQYNHDPVILINH